MRGVWLALAVGASIVSSAATPVHALNIIRLTRLGDGDVRPGDRVRVQVGFDFSDTTLGGGIDILFDPSSLRCSGFRYSPTLTRDPAFDLVRWLPDGLLVAFGQFDGFSGKQVIGEFDLYVAYIAPLPVVKRIEARPNYLPAGPFVRDVDENGVRILPVEFTGGFDVTILEGPPPPPPPPDSHIPEPASGTSLALGLAMLAVRAREQPRCKRSLTGLRSFRRFVGARTRRFFDRHQAIPLPAAASRSTSRPGCPLHRVSGR